jgi:hypothetical protein
MMVMHNMVQAPVELEMGLVRVLAQAQVQGMVRGQGQGMVRVKGWGRGQERGRGRGRGEGRGQERGMGRGRAMERLVEKTWCSMAQVGVARQEQVEGSRWEALPVG